MTGDGLDAFNMTLSYLLHEAVGRLSAEDRQERIDYCQRSHWGVRRPSSGVPIPLRNSCTPPVIRRPAPCWA
jgi:hypothetical protein